MLHTEYGHEKTHAYQILRDSYALWGDAYELNKRGASKVLVESAYVALQIAVRDKNGELILKAVKELRELQQIDKVESAISPEMAIPAGTGVYVFNGPVNVGTPDPDPLIPSKMAHTASNKEVRIKVNPAQGRFLWALMKNTADFEKDGKKYQTGFRATFNGAAARARPTP